MRCAGEPWPSVSSWTPVQSGPGIHVSAPHTIQVTRVVAIVPSPIAWVRFALALAPVTGGGPRRQGPPDQVGTVATATVALPEGLWTIRTISDDGIRGWIDDQLIIDDWTWHPAKEDRVTVPLQAGLHTIRIEHFEIDGYARLALFLEPAAGSQ